MLIYECTVFNFLLYKFIVFNLQILDFRFRCGGVRILLNLVMHFIPYTLGRSNFPIPVILKNWSMIFNSSGLSFAVQLSHCWFLFVWFLQQLLVVGLSLVYPFISRDNFVTFLYFLNLERGNNILEAVIYPNQTKYQYLQFFFLFTNIFSRSSLISSSTIH